MTMRGVVVLSYSIFCGCAQWTGYQNTVKDAKREARRLGWKWTRADGWRCPQCLSKDAENVCEHGDHPAPVGMRFCSKACEECEHTDHDAEKFECAGICEGKEH